MEYHIEERKDVIIIYCQERLDINSSWSLEEEVMEKLDKNFKYFVFELTNTQYISSSGIRVIVSTHNKLKSRGGALYLANLSDSVRVIIKLVELEGILNIVDSLETALNAINEKRK
jgi:anti-sigma B factor antagonist